MKILYLHQYFGTRRDGHSTRSYEFARKLLERGHRVTMISASIETTLRKDEARRRYNIFDVEGIKVIQLNEKYSTGLSIKKRMGAFIRFAWFATVMGLREKNVDLVFATTTPLTVAIPGILCAKKHKAPFVFEVRDLWPELPIAMGLTNPLIVKPMRWLEQWSYRNAARIIALAPGIKEGIIKAGFPAARIDFIPNAADTDLFFPAENFNGKKEITLVFTGMHGRANGLEAVVEAAEILKKRAEFGIKFLLIGKGAEKPKLMESCRQRNLDNIEFKDTVPKMELTKILQLADVGMMILKNVPAFYNGTSPNKFFDYLAAGLPVLNNYPGWLQELIEREKCGIAVPPDNPQAFADAVIYLRDHPEERKAMSQRARKLAEEVFCRDKLAAEFADILEMIYRQASEKSGEILEKVD